MASFALWLIGSWPGFHFVGQIVDYNWQVVV